MSDVRRQNMMIMDMLTNAQESMHTSADALQSFTRSEIMRDSAANMEMSIRDVIVNQFGKMQDALLGDSDHEGGDRASLKSAVNAMVMRLEDSASRLELANGNQGASAKDQEQLAENIRQELQAVALALSQQQRDTAQESVAQMGAAVREQIGPLQTAQAETAVALTEKVTALSNSVAEGVGRLETEVDRVLQTVEAAATKPSGGDKRASRVDRG
mmetsp:Transcript_4871/g.11277  ORF Transcript_4871/g.11277 Transcript_4871/m.11277 type:complete len:215 (+) Transcript_4871:3-647(+)